MGNFSIFGKNGKMRLRNLLATAVVLVMAQGLLAQQGYHAAARDLQPDKAFDNVLVQRLYGDAHASGFVIWVKHDVPLHKHAAHSETVIVLAGKAHMTLGDQHQTVRKGDVIFIPQGTPHAVHVDNGVLKVLSIQAPEFDGTDRILID
jgi:quercetin dioxygenase-like cupin family protein